MTTPSAFDALREFTTAPHIRDFEACGVIARDLRAAVAEHDALRERARQAEALAKIHREERDACANEAVRLTREHDALRDAVRGYLATLPESERDSTCGYGDCFDAAAFYGHEDGRLFCRAHSRHCRPITEPLPPRVVTLRALAALVRS